MTNMEGGLVTFAMLFLAIYAVPALAASLFEFTEGRKSRKKLNALIEQDNLDHYKAENTKLGRRVMELEAENERLRRERVYR